MPKKQNKLNKIEEPLFLTDNGDAISVETILKDIYQNTLERDKHIKDTAKSIAEKITKPSDAVLLMPYFTQLQQVAVKNMDGLVRTLAIVHKQKAVKTDGLPEELDGLPSPDDFKSWQNELKNMNNQPAGSSNADY
ncbi:MAG: hypothetical protein EBS55_08355 [Flavobacteriaceae bacterium]|nr:hypothetical protein [Flavobacteriaceae bacterium]